MDIKEIRQKIGITQQALADSIGVAVFTVRRWESGKCKPSPLAQEKLDKLVAKWPKLLGSKNG